LACEQDCQQKMMGKAFLAAIAICAFLGCSCAEDTVCAHLLNMSQDVNITRVVVATTPGRPETFEMVTPCQDWFGAGNAPVLAESTTAQSCELVRKSKTSTPEDSSKCLLVFVCPRRDHAWDHLFMLQITLPTLTTVSSMIIKGRYLDVAVDEKNLIGAMPVSINEATGESHPLSEGIKARGDIVSYFNVQEKGLFLKSISVAGSAKVGDEVVVNKAAMNVNFQLHPSFAAPDKQVHGVTLACSDSTAVRCLQSHHNTVLHDNVYLRHHMTLRDDHPQELLPGFYTVVVNLGDVVYSSITDFVVAAEWGAPAANANPAHDVKPSPAQPSPTGSTVVVNLRDVVYSFITDFVVAAEWGASAAKANPAHDVNPGPAHDSPTGSTTAGAGSGIRRGHYGASSSNGGAIVGYVLGPLAFVCCVGGVLCAVLLFRAKKRPGVPLLGHLNRNCDL